MGGEKWSGYEAKLQLILSLIPRFNSHFCILDIRVIGLEGPGNKASIYQTMLLHVVHEGNNS